MKMIQYMLPAFTACILAGACTKQLDQLPTTSKVGNQFFTTQNEAEEYISSVYGTLQRVGLYGQYLPVLAEISSDNTWDQVPANDNGYAGQLDLFTTIPSNGILSLNWSDSYVAIQRANVVLNRIDAVSYQTDSVKTARKGAMKFVRALIYFNLVRTYGDVPLVTKETTNTNDYFGQGRTNKDTIYTQIVKDLKDAITALPAVADQKGGIVKTAAQALLGKVYLTLAQYPEAIAILNTVVNSGVHSLLSTPGSIFSLSNELNAEIIFAVQFAAGVNGNTEGSPLQQQSSPSGFISGAKGHNLPTRYLYNMYSNADLRKGTYLDTTKQGVPYCKKYTANASNPTDGGSDFVVLRYADVLLMLAEASNESGNTADALTYLNKIRNRAGLTSFLIEDQTQIRNEISLQRQLELVGEGHRWFDLLHTTDPVNTMNTYFKTTGQNITIKDFNLLMPIPQDQVDTDPSIKQNTGYN
ncbi:Starch-binding associating with outer membrane [Filimonas lacunae]|uniref:Starch-binding associating with outer membrane n=1 Tax=Filimonas lacunae TaxID=477680 RepID=A0A173MGE7_9BACT|nr:RagB/SusD family nutrient uptake outer membrane protein [Filimonas lacunae]BAV06665.1 outer membrane protein, nutrient binding [Filimonas lacunae]SIT27819.1 Starch-binding associating with outer membrane [Filimonas lacunae]